MENITQITYYFNNGKHMSIKKPLDEIITNNTCTVVWRASQGQLRKMQFNCDKLDYKVYEYI